MEVEIRLVVEGIERLGDGCRGEGIALRNFGLGKALWWDEFKVKNMIFNFLEKQVRQIV